MTRSDRITFLLWGTVSSVGMLLAGCSGSVNSAKQCEYGDEVYEAGDTFPDLDGCNDCRCEEGGEVACTLKACTTVPLFCAFDGELYENGEGVPGYDPCNACFCNEGSIACTTADCAVDPACSLPFEVGMCDAAISVYWYNPETGACEEQSYGGCGGNANRYDTLDECVASCGASPDGSCVVDGVTYPDGATDVPDPQSCNTCSCENGVVTTCTEIHCPTSCDEGFSLETVCDSCGPGDGCEALNTRCVPVCESQSDCDAAGEGACMGGVCLTLCG